MKILLIYPVDISVEKKWNGITTHTHLTAEYLAKLGHNVTLLLPGKRNNTKQVNSYTLKRLQTGLGSKKILMRLWLALFSNRLRYFNHQFIWALHVYKFLRKARHYDIIETSDWGSSTFFVSILLRDKVIIRLHRSTYIYRKDNHLPINLDNRLISFLETTSILFSTALTAPTKHIFSCYPLELAYARFRHKPIRKIPYGVTINPRSGSAKTSAPPFLLTVGRVEHAKGQHILIQALIHALPQCPSLNIIIIGEDTHMYTHHKYHSYKNYLQKTVNKHKLNNNVSILAPVARHQLHKYYRDCLAVVVPSVGNENQPLVMLEAMSFGKPVIASNAGGITETIKDKINGLIFRQNDPLDLSQKMITLVKNPSLQKKLANTSLKLVSNYDIHLAAQKTANFYSEILKRSK